MDLHQHSSSTAKWQEMSAIVDSHSTLTQPDFLRQFKKLFIFRLLTENILIFLLQYAGLMFSTLTLHKMPLWFASGTACAFIFLRGYTILPGIWLGSFFAYYFANVSPILAAECASIHALQALLLLWISHRFISPTLVFNDVKTFLKFLFTACVLTAVASFMLELGCYSALRNPVDPLQLWLQWWLANLNGILVFSTALITLDMYFPQIHALKELKMGLFSLLYGLLLMCILVMLFSHDKQVIVGFALSILSLAIITSYVYGWCGAILAVSMLGLSLSLAALFDAPLFSTQYSWDTLIYLQIILGAAAISGLFFAVWREGDRRSPLHFSSWMI